MTSVADPQTTPPKAAPTLASQVGDKAERKKRSRRRHAPGVWFGLGLMGVIGWSVVVPTLAGAALGLWLDGRFPGGRSWTLALMAAGLVLGCFNAWHWVSSEEAAMREQEGDESHDG